MKKIQFAAVIVILLMTGCAKEVILSENPATNAAIGFGTYLGNSPISKANTADAEALSALKMSEGFGVYAYWQVATGTWANTATPNLMTNTQIKWTDGAPSGSWGYQTPTDTRYWSTTDTDEYTFLAYAPWVSGESLSNGTIAMPDYSALSTGHDTDFLVAVSVKDSPRSNYESDNTVDLVFKHAKAKLAVKAELGSEEQTATSGAVLSVSKIKIGDIHTTGSVSLDLAADGKVAWSYQGGTTREVEFTLSGNSTSDTHLVVPANYTSLPVEVTYSLTQGSVTYQDQTAKGSLNLDISGSTSYLLTVFVGLDEIKFDVTQVDGWGDATPKDLGNVQAE